MRYCRLSPIAIQRDKQMVRCPLPTIPPALGRDVLTTRRNLMHVPNWCCIPALAILAMRCFTIQAAETPFAWQQDYARVTETGDIEWTPTRVPLRGGRQRALHRLRKRLRRRRRHLAAAALEAPSLGRRRHRQRRRGQGDRDLRIQGWRGLSRAAHGQGTRPARLPDPPDPRSELGRGPRHHRRLAGRHRLEQGRRSPQDPRARCGVEGHPGLRAAHACG